MSPAQRPKTRRPLDVKHWYTGEKWRVDTTDIVQAAVRLLGERDLALYLEIDQDLLHRYAAGSDEVPRLVLLRIVDRLLSESADPFLALEAMADVLHELQEVPP